MKVGISVIVVSAFLAMPLCTHAAGATVGAATKRTVVNGGADDQELTQTALHEAFVEGLRAAGVPLRAGQTDWVADASFQVLHVPQLNNLRQVSSLYAMRYPQPVGIGGDTWKNVVPCYVRSATWRAGTPSVNHANEILASIRQDAADFAKRCVL